MKKILLVEDDAGYSSSFTRALETAGHRVTVVATLPSDPADSKFQDLLARAAEFDLVIWDANMIDVQTWEKHIPAFKKVFAGPMIAASSVNHFSLLQVEAGCTHSLKGNKNVDELVAVMQQIFRTP